MQSLNLERRAEEFFPGGVNSPVRAFRAVGGRRRLSSAPRAHELTDADGNRYIDYFGSWGPMILGHAFPPVVEAIERAARNSRQLRRLHGRRGRSGRAHRRLFPGHREVALRQLRHRGHDERDPVGPRRHRAQDYHQVRGLLPRPRRRPAGQGRLRRGYLGIPGSAGVPEEIAALHPRPALQQSRPRSKPPSPPIRRQIACVIVEPVVGNAGCIPPAPGYLRGCAQIAAKHGALLIFDEVMTGFRVALGGAQELYGINPDLTTLGKIIGGGLPVGAFGGARRHGPARAARPGLPGRNAQRQSAGNGRRNRDAQAPHRARGADLSAGSNA